MEVSGGALAMKLFLKTSGGIGNIQLQGQLDTDDLEGELADRVNAVLDPTSLSAMPSPEAGFMADAMQYDIGLFLDSGLQQFVISEASAPHDVLGVVEELVQELIRQKRAAL